MTPFRADVRSGNSGGPVVDLDGDVADDRVRGLDRRRAPTNGLGVPNRVVARALGGKLAPDGHRTMCSLIEIRIAASRC